MGAFRDYKREARKIVHETMSFEACYFVEPYDPATSEVKKITVRVHDKFLALGDLKGTNFNYAELEAVAPQLIFWREELDDMERNAIVSVERGVAYRIDSTKPDDDQTRTASISRIPREKTEGFPLPEDF